MLAAAEPTLFDCMLRTSAVCLNLTHSPSRVYACHVHSFPLATDRCLGTVAEFSHMYILSQWDSSQPAGVKLFTTPWLIAS